MNKFVYVTTLLICTFATSFSYAASSTDTTYILRITAKNQYNSVPFNATYMAITDNGSSLERIQETTPYEYPIPAKFIGIMLETDAQNPGVKMELVQRNNNHDTKALTGSGHAIFAHVSVNGGNYIIAR